MALRLLRENVVSELFLNDLDCRITAFWNAALNEPDRFVDTIYSVPVSIKEWKRQRQIYMKSETNSQFELGFSVFYLNRCNRSGVLQDGAPIGGYAQDGKWKINARFYRKSLADRIQAIAKNRDRIHITNMDAVSFLSQYVPRGNKRSKVFVYFDPPYFLNGNRLYTEYYKKTDHLSLSNYILRQRQMKWVMSYDDAQFIRNLYKCCAIAPLPLQYSFQRKKRTLELLISPSYLKVPNKSTRLETDVLKRSAE